MSQAKVEQYKKDKANRKKTMKKEKMQRIAGRICACAILVVIVGWAGSWAMPFLMHSGRLQEAAWRCIDCFGNM